MLRSRVLRVLCLISHRPLDYALLVSACPCPLLTQISPAVVPGRGMGHRRPGPAPAPRNQHEKPQSQCHLYQQCGCVSLISQWLALLQHFARFSLSRRGPDIPLSVAARGTDERVWRYQAGILTDAKGIKVAATEYWGSGAKKCDPLARPRSGASTVV